MAIFKALNGQHKYFNPDARTLVTNYILNPLKSPSGFRRAVAVSQDVVGSMDEVAKRFHKESGVQLRHFIVAYRPDELDDPDDVDSIAEALLMYIGQKYQAIYAVHEDTQNLHFHMMFNPISYVDGTRFRGTRKEHYDLMKQIEELNHYFGIKRLDYVSTTSEEDIQ